METKTSLKLVLLLLLQLLFRNTNNCLGADTISANQSLSVADSCCFAIQIDSFKEVLRIALPENERSALDGDSEIKTCQSTCLNDCSCTAYAFIESHCLIWMGDLLNLKSVAGGDSNGSSLYVRRAAYPKESSRSRNRRYTILFFGMISSSVVISCAACSVYYMSRKILATRRGN